MNAHLQPVLARALAPMAPPQSVVHQIVAADAAAVTPAERRMLLDLIDAGNRPRFAVTYCSQCGNAFGPGDEGFSDCRDHQRAADLRIAEALAIREHHMDEYRTGLDDVDGRFGGDDEWEDLE